MNSEGGGGLDTMTLIVWTVLFVLMVISLSRIRVTLDAISADLKAFHEQPVEVHVRYPEEEK